MSDTKIHEAETLWIKDIQGQMKTTGNFKLLAMQLRVIESEKNEERKVKMVEKNENTTRVRPQHTAPKGAGWKTRIMLDS